MRSARGQVRPFGRFVDRWAYFSKEKKALHKGKPFLLFQEVRYTVSHNITPLVIGLWTLRFSERIAQGLCLYPNGMHLSI